MTIDEKLVTYLFNEYIGDLKGYGECNKEIYEKLELQCVYENLKLKPDAKVTYGIIKTKSHSQSAHAHDFLCKLAYGHNHADSKTVNGKKLKECGLLEKCSDHDYFEFFVVKKKFVGNGSNNHNAAH